MATGQDHRTSIGPKGSARPGKAIPRCSHRRDHHVLPPGQGVHGDLYVPSRHRGPARAEGKVSVSATERLVIGLPEEQADFASRNARFFEVWPRLHDTIDRAFFRQFRPGDVVQKVVFTLGRLAVEDFMEIMVVCGNGYGM